MASLFQPLAIQYMLQELLETADVKAALVDTGTYTYSAAHQYLDDLSGVVDTTGNLTGKTFSAAGVFDAADAPISAITGDSVEYVWVYVDSGSAATSRLVAYCEVTAAYTPTGADIMVVWDAAGICGT